MVVDWSLFRLKKQREAMVFTKPKPAMFFPIMAVIPFSVGLVAKAVNAAPGISDLIVREKNDKNEKKPINKFKKKQQGSN